MKKTKTRNLRLIIGLCAVVTVAFGYQQMNSTSVVHKVDVIEQVEKSSSIGIQSSHQEKTAQVDLHAPSKQSVETNSQIRPERNKEALKASTDKVPMPNIARQHNKPADHMSANLPEHHGHEHDQPRRHPIDNSIMPPGEPKKPLPTEKDKR